MKNKRIFVCSPYRGDIETNVKRAKRICNDLANLGFVPIAPHLYFPQFLDDAIEIERQRGITMGMSLLKDCDAVYVYGKPTEGMKQEIQFAEALGITVYYPEVEVSA
jgi:dienelactone hydrolase